MSIKLSAEASQFRKEMQSAVQSVKNLEQESKLAAAELRKTGDAQSYTEKRTATLTRQIEEQKRAVDAVEKAYRAEARAQGESAESTKQLAGDLARQRAALINLEADLQEVTKGTDKMRRSVEGGSAATKELGQIANATRFTAFKSALDSVTGKLNGMASSAKRLGQSLWNTAKESAAWADDLATNATKYGLDPQTLQQWQYAAHFVDVEVTTIAGASNKLLSVMRADSAALRDLGVQARTSSGSLRDTQTVFWDTITALGRLTDETERDSAAQEVFGKSFAELKPLIDAGRDSWEAYCDEAERAGLVLGNDQLAKLNSFNDSLDRLGATGLSLRNGIMAELAPGFEAIADTATEAAQSILEWTRTSEGKAAINGLTDAIKGLMEQFADGGLKDMIKGVTDAVTWLGNAANNTGDLLGKLKLGLGIYGGMRLAAGGLRIANGVTNLLHLGGGGAAGGGILSGLGGSLSSMGMKAASGLRTAMLSPLGSGMLGFGGGIASVLGVGALAKALDNGRVSDFGMSANGSYKALLERNQAREEAQQAKHDKSFLNGIGEKTEAIVTAIEELHDGTDWRADSRQSIASMTAKDITEAIKNAGLNFRPGEESKETPQSNVQAEINITVEAIAAMTNDGKVEKHEIEAVQKYVLEHFNPAIEEAVSLITGGWGTVLGAMESPPAGTTPTTPAEGTEAEAEYTAMSDYVDSRMTDDYNTAMGEAQRMWSEVEKATYSPSGSTGDDGEAAAINGSTYMTEKVAELVKVRDEIQLLVDYIAEHAGETIDQSTLDRLENLMDRAEQLGAEVGWYGSEAAVQGRGAMGMAMQGINWEVSAPLAYAYAKALREHELEGIESDLLAKQEAAGNLFLDYAGKKGVLDDITRAANADGIFTAEEQSAMMAAEDEYEAAKAAYEKAKVEAERAEKAAEEKRVNVEKEYQDNLSEITAGAAKVIGYEGGGKGTYVPVTPGTAFSAGALTPQESMMLAASLSGYAMGSARNWPVADSQAKDILLRRQANMTPEARTMADLLYAKYGTYDAFMAALPEAQRESMQGILNYTEGVGGEGDYWSNVMFNAFGRLPNNTYYNAGMNSYVPFDSSSFNYMSAFLGYKPKETQDQFAENLAAATANALNESLQQQTAAYNEGSGYNAFREVVKNLADTGMFAGMDWSQIDGGMTEDVLADLKAEAEANGEDVGEKFGTGMEKSKEMIFEAGKTTGQAVSEGTAIGINTSAHIATEAASKMALDVIDTINSIMDVHSPSKVMEGIGIYVGQGFAQGIAATIDQVQGAVYGMASAVVQPFAGSGHGGRGGSTYNSSSSIYVDTYYQNSAEDISYINQQLADMQRRQLQGFGHGR